MALQGIIEALCMIIALLLSYNPFPNISKAPEKLIDQLYSETAAKVITGASSDWDYQLVQT